MSIGTIADLEDADAVREKLNLALATVDSLYDVKNYGAIGDGSSHALSTVYGSLGAAQAVYPHATALTDQIDWCAIQAAINAASATTRGGTVYLPAGRYRTNQEIVLPTGNLGDWTPGKQVNIQGAAEGASQIILTTDLGAGKYAITVSTRATDPNNTLTSFGEIADLTLVGPTANGITLGTAPCSMNGIGVVSGRRLKRVHIHFFNYGVSIRGDHTQFQEVISEYCYYAFYWDKPDVVLWGDFLFNKCASGLNAKACMAVHPEASILGVVFDQCFFGTSPYMIWKEGGGSSAVILYECMFRHCYFEGWGNGIVDSDQSGNYGNITRTVFDALMISRNSTYKIVAEDRSAVIRCSSLTDVTFMNFRNPSTAVPGDDAWFRTGDGLTRVLFQDCEEVIDACVTASTPFLHADAATGSSISTPLQFELVEPGRWRGKMASVPASTALTRYTVLEYNTSSGVSNEVQAGTTDLTKPTAGIAMTGLSSVAARAMIPIATSGQRVSVVGAVGNNSMFKRAAAGAIASTTTRSDAIGIAHYTSGGTSVCTVFGNG
jgi:hypothetical protein